MLQTLTVALIVTGAFAYSVWALMPAAWQRALRRWRGLAVPAEAGGCSACGGGCAAARKPGSAGPAGPARSEGPGPVQAVITLHRRLPASGGAASQP
jgi:hypothetical protein